MEFYIKKNATLPVLKMQVVKDGRSGYLQLMQDLEVSIIYFTMIDVETGIPKIARACNSNSVKFCVPAKVTIPVS